jgi:N-methylhydantoinase A
VGRRALGTRQLITFDIGGTSADIGIVTGGRFAEVTARDSRIGGFPILVPIIDIHTIGAGGGSIARRDSGGAFRVGRNQPAPCRDRPATAAADRSRR